MSNVTPDSPSRTPPLRFEDYLLDTGTRELSLAGAVVAIEPRVFDLLVFLAANSERAVSKDELQDGVWPGLVVSETALTRAIMKARRAVGDDANTQRVIKTVHGHGYRFVAKLEAEQPAMAAAPQRVAVPPPDATSVADAERSAAVVSAPTRFWRLSLPVFAAAVLIAVAAWVVLRPTLSPSSDARVAVLPVENMTGDEALNWTRLGLMSLARGNLANRGLQVVADSRVVELSENLDTDAPTSEATLLRLDEKLRRAYGVSHVVSMRLETNAGALRMHYTVRAPDGSEAHGTMVGDETTALARGVAREAYTNITGRRLLPSDATAGSDDAFINEAYARGKGLSLEGRCEAAQPLFQAAIAQDAALLAPRLDYAICARILGDMDEAETLLKQLIAEQLPNGASPELALAQQTLGVLYIRNGHKEQAVEMLDQALVSARAIEDSDRAGDVLVNLAIMAKDRSELEHAVELLGRARVAYERAGRETPPGTLYNTLSNIAMARGALAESEGFLEQALDAFRLVGDRRREAMMLNNTGFLRRRQGRLDEAEKFHLQSLAIREDIGDRVGVGRIRGMLALLYLERGELSVAQTSAIEALTIARDTQDRLFEATSLAQLAEIKDARGFTADAITHYRESRDVFRTIQDHLRVLQVEIRLGRLALRDGDLETALMVADDVVTRAAGGEMSEAEIEALELRADVALAGGDIEDAAGRYAAALTRVQAMSWSGKETELATKLASVHLDRNDPAAAEPLVGALLSQPQTAATLRVRARYAFTTDTATEAVRLMEQARAAAGDLWAASDEEQLQVYQAARAQSHGADVDEGQ